MWNDIDETNFIDYLMLDANPNCTLNDIKELDIVNYNALSQNPNITWKYVRDHLGWNYSYLSANKFNKHEYLIKKKYYKIWRDRIEYIKCLKYWKTIYISNIDILKLRRRDFDHGII